MLRIQDQIQRSIEEGIAKSSNIDQINEEAIQRAIEETDRLTSSDAVRRNLNEAAQVRSEQLRRAEEEIRRVQEEIRKALDELRRAVEDLRQTQQQQR